MIPTSKSHKKDQTPTNGAQLHEQTSSFENSSLKNRITLHSKRNQTSLISILARITLCESR